MTLTTERLQFEQWWETAMHNGYPPRFGWEHWRDGDGYRDDDGEFQGLWQAWQASRGFLANREAQPVALVDRRPAASGGICWQHGGKDLPHGTELFTAPPAPAVNAAPDFEAWFVEKYKQPERLMKNGDGAYKFSGVQMAFSAWVDGRAAMLAQPVSSGYTLPPHVFRELVNSLRDTAVKYQGTQQLREQLSRTLTDKGLSAAAPEGGN
ncbi:hypothetical protein [Serratia marcescens]|uniref:hypothetical protein n=1 Tax=Serratia marcescens TaxID=615 RepID=UPI000F7E1A75|nr:hypothetical protein [Serratia marcescens]RTF47803.1 hypothetical protein D9B78_11740 [Serratia marcescens]